MDRSAVRAFLLKALCVIAMLAPIHAFAQAGCSAGACVSAGPRLVSVDSSRAPLLNVLFQGLLPGSSVQLSVLDWNALATGNVGLNALVTQLGTSLGVSSTDQVLGAQITLAQLQAALVQVAQADGNTAAVGAVNRLLASAGAASGTVSLGELLRVSLPKGALADVRLNLLDLLTGSAQLYNYRNVLTTPTPIAVDTAALGLTGVASLQLWLQVVEPPVYACGNTGTAFHTGAVRIKLNLQALNGLDLAPILDAVNALGLLNASVTADVVKLQVYADVARAEGTISAVDGLADTVTLNARPGLVGLYVGQIADSVFFNRNAVITEAVVAAVPLTSLAVRFNVNLLGLGLAAVDVPLKVNVRAAATGAPGLQSLTVSGPFPKTVRTAAGTVSLTGLVTSLVSNLAVTLDTGATVVTLLGVQIPVPALVVNLVNSLVSAVLSVIGGVVNALVAPLLNVVLGGLLDPLLASLGIQVGVAQFTVEGVARSCTALLSMQSLLSPSTGAGRFNLSIAEGSTPVASASNVGHEGATTPVATKAATAYTLSEQAAANTDLAHYVITWACSDQDGNALGSGSGAQFTYTSPEISNRPRTITCRVTNRSRQADLSITKQDASPTYTPGTDAVYVITVANAGPDGVEGAVIRDALPAGATLSAPWTCEAARAGICAAAAGGAAGETQLQLQVDLQANEQATIRVPVRFSSVPGDY